VESGRTTFDPDLDVRPPRPLRDSIAPIDGYQRLVANPFLAVLGWLVAFGVLIESVKREKLALFMTAIILFFVGFFFLQFHCLDCGATGLLLKSSSHACPAVVERRQRQRARRFRGPGVKLQLVAWFIFLMTAFILALVMHGERR
jgi:hypothetical protein